MKTTSFHLVLALFTACFGATVHAKQPKSQPAHEVDLAEESRQALEYLNQVRENPDAYAQELGWNPGDIAPVAAYNGDGRLMRVSHRKACYMACKGKVSHDVIIDGRKVGMNTWMREEGYPLSAKRPDSGNGSECLAAGPLRTGCGVERMQNLLRHPPHRDQLLSRKPNEPLNTDAGCALVTSNGKVYISVNMAKQN